MRRHGRLSWHLWWEVLGLYSVRWAAQIVFFLGLGIGAALWVLLIAAMMQAR